MGRTRNFINNKDLLDALIQYRERLKYCEDNNKPKPQVTDYIGQSILLICNNLAKRPNFSGYSYKEDMISDAIIFCLRAVDNFDSTRTNNPFGYFTQVAWNAFLQRIQKEKKENYVKHKNFENSFLMNDLWDNSENMHLSSNDFSDKVISDFEEKNPLTKTKKKNTIKGIEKFQGDI